VVNKDTKLCISLASFPSDFGTTLHNAAYASLGLNFIYKAFSTGNLAGALTGVRALDIRGCSVSMPFKEEVLPLLDDLEQTARVIGAVNTVVNEGGWLTGYNTDVSGARKALESIRADPDDSVLLLGAGGVARAIVFALRQLGFRKVQVSTRDQKKIQHLNSILPSEVVPWEVRHKVRADLLINATSIGMSPGNDQSPIKPEFLMQTRAVMDVVVSPLESSLIRMARSMGNEVAPGYFMCLEQAIEQFKLYTGEVPPRDVMMQAIKRLLAD
jgi:shikimate dehydrogenase